MPIYYLANAVNELIELIANAEDDGQRLEYERLLAETQAELDKRLHCLCSWCRNLELEIEAYETEGRRLREEKTSREKKLERIKNYLGILVGEGNKWSQGTHKISWRKSTSLQIDEGSSIHPLFCKHIEEHDKESIREHLLGGGTLDFARMIEKQNIQVK